MKRIAVGGIVHETNAFATIKATLKTFHDHTYLTGGAMITALYGTSSPVGGVLSALRKFGYEAVPLLYTAATPCGEVDADSFDIMVNDLLGRLSDALPVDGVILVLHGAMAASNTPDCDGIIMQKTRHVAGPGIPLVSVLDFHANISRTMFRECDVLVGYDKNPHTDTYEKGMNAVTQMHRLLSDGKIPRKRLIQLPLVLSPLTNWTDANPFHSVLDLTEEFRQNNDIHCITVAGGFAYALGAEVGVSVAVHGANQEAVDQCAQKCAALIWANRHAALYSGVTAEQAIGQALFSLEPTVVLADMGDNIGGGAPGDGTHILDALVRLQVKGAFLTVWDPIAASSKSDYFNGIVGGHSDPRGGKPIPVQGPVIKRCDGKYRIGARNPYSAITGASVDIGESILVDADGIHVLITSKAAPQGDLELYDHIGVDPRQYKILVVKGAVAFRDAYQPLTNIVLDVNTDGVCNCDLRKIPYNEPTSGLYPMNPACIWQCHEEWYN
jgi:microcystin degradation protein MlrC